MPIFNFKENKSAPTVKFSADDELYAVKKVLDHLGKDKFMMNEFVLTKEVVTIIEEKVEIPNLSELP